MGAGADPFHGRAGAHEAAQRKAAADTLGHRDQVRVGVTVGPFVGEQAPGPAHAALHFVVDQQQPEFVTDRPQGAQVVQVRRGNAAFALDRFDQNGSGFFSDRRAGLVQIVEGHVVEAVDRRAEAFEVLGVVGGSDGRQRPTVEGVAGADDAVLLRIAVDVVVSARGLEAAFQRFGARIAEEHQIGKGVGDQLFCQLALVWNLVEVRGVPQLPRLIPQGFNQNRVRVPERVDGDA